MPDAWQRDVAMALLAVRADAKWAAFEFGLEVPRQNGKGGVYEIREIYGLFVLRERLLVHSAHEYKTAEQALDRMEALIDGCADLSREVRTIKRSHGQEGIYLKSGQTLRYATRTAGALRGWSCDFLGLDEAMKIKASMLASVFPTMSARPNPQILYAGSSVDQETMADGVVFARVRERGIQGGDPRLAYFGYSAPFDHPSEVTDEDAKNPEHWAAGNPALGIRITPEYIEMEQRALDARSFAVERLGVGDWPVIDGTEDRVIDLDAWLALADAASVTVGTVCFAFDVTPDRSTSSVAVAGRRADGLAHVEVIERRAGTEWVTARVADLVNTHGSDGVICDARGPAASLIPELKAAGVQVRPVNASEHAQACGVLFDAVEQDGLRHLGTPDLTAAIKGAMKRPLGDAWAWSRKDSSVDISPLVACTLALRGVAAVDASQNVW